MKWIGQHIYDLISRFRSDVYLEDLSTTTETNVLVVDSTGKVSKSTTLADDIIEAEIDTLPGLISIGTAGTSTIFSGSSFQIINTTTSSTSQGGVVQLVSNDGAALGDDHRLGVVSFAAAEDASSTYKVGASIQAFADAAWSSTENGTRLEFSTMDGNGATELSLTLDSDLLATFTGAVTVTGALTGTLATASQPNITGVGTIDTGVWNGTAIARAYLDADTIYLSVAQDITGEKTIGGEAAPTNKLYFRDANAYINSPTANDLAIAGRDITLDAGTSVKIETSALTMYDPVNDGNPTISLGSSATNRLEIKTAYNSGAQTLDSVSFTSYTQSGSTHDGRFFFYVDEVQKFAINDNGIGSYGTIFANADDAFITTTNSTASSATEGGELRLICDDGAAMADDHRLGVIEFSGAEDASNNRQTGARIQAMCDAAWSASENGTRLEFYTMDGNASSELSLTLDSDLLATFAGAVTVTGALTGTLATASQPNITTVGTIDTGVWNGTAIATDYLKHKSTFELAGYAVADGTNYMMADIMSGNKAPFLHDETSIGANGTTADNPAAFLRAAGTVMPYNGTLKIWKGWGASSGTPTVDIGIFKYSPTADDATSDSLVLVKNTQITGAGNDNLKAFSETSFSVTVTAGDILITAIKGSADTDTAYFTSTVEIEWTS